MLKIKKNTKINIIIDNNFFFQGLILYYRYLVYRMGLNHNAMGCVLHYSSKKTAAIMKNTPWLKYIIQYWEHLACFDGSLSFATLSIIYFSALHKCPKLIMPYLIFYSSISSSITFFSLTHLSKVSK